MSGIFLGGDAIEAVKVGSEDAVAVYVGSELVWPVSGGYLTDTVDPLNPTYFWPMQGDLVASHGGIDLAGVNHGGFGTTGPGMDPGDIAVHGTLRLDGTTAINANANTTAYTFGGWFRMDTWAADKALVSNGLVGTIYVTTTTVAGDTLRIYHNGAFTQTVHGIAAATWFHIMARWDGTTQKMYINGAEVASVARTGALGAATNFQIGTYSNRSLSRMFGAAAWVGWWVNTALDPSDIAALAGV